MLGILGKKSTARRMNPEANSQHRLSPAEKREFPVGLRLTPHTLNLRQAELFQPPAHINSHVPKHADLILLQLPPTHTPPQPTSPALSPAFHPAGGSLRGPGVCQRLEPKDRTAAWVRTYARARAEKM